MIPSPVCIWPWEMARKCSIIPTGIGDTFLTFGIFPKEMTMMQQVAVLLQLEQLIALIRWQLLFVYAIVRGQSHTKSVHTLFRISSWVTWPLPRQSGLARLEHCWGTLVKGPPHSARCGDGACNRSTRVSSHGLGWGDLPTFDGPTNLTRGLKTVDTGRDQSRANVWGKRSTAFAVLIYSSCLKFGKNWLHCDKPLNEMPSSQNPRPSWLKRLSRLSKGNDLCQSFRTQFNCRLIGLNW